VLLLEYLRSVLNRRIDRGDDASCVDLVNDRLADLGLPPVRGNAVDVAGQRVGGHVWVANNPTNWPSAGDLVVWNRNVTVRGIGEYGHVAIAVAADAMVLLTLDQNWPAGAPAGLIVHDYVGVAGWQHKI
jgi:hypothetical protein